MLGPKEFSVVLLIEPSVVMGAGEDACGPRTSRPASTEAPSELSKQKRAAFQILLAKFRYDSTCFSFQRISVVPTCAKVRRVASTPYLSKTSTGSTPFIFVFDILWPWLSRIVPVIKTSSKGSRPINFAPIITIRETQRKMMSRAVTRTLDG